MRQENRVRPVTGKNKELKQIRSKQLKYVTQSGSSEMDSCQISKGDVFKSHAIALHGDLSFVSL